MSESTPPEILRSSSPSNRIRTQPLTSRQERRLVEHVEEVFLDIMRNYKKRDYTSTTLPTLRSYLRATHTLLSLILQIPPVGPQQAALRTALLLRFTSETLSAITHYPRPNLSEREAQGNGDRSGTGTLRELLEWLDELDRGWYAVLCSQAWDPTTREGVDAEFSDSDKNPRRADQTDEVIHEAADRKTGTDIEEDYTPTSLNPSSAISQTDRARLRSLLLLGDSALEEWLEGVQPITTGVSYSETRRHNGSLVVANREGPEMESDSVDLESTLEHLGLQQAFDDLFSRTLTAMGELGGEVLSAGEELEME